MCVCVCTLILLYVCIGSFVLCVLRILYICASDPLYMCFNFFLYVPALVCVCLCILATYRSRAKKLRLFFCLSVIFCGSWRRRCNENKCHKEHVIVILLDCCFCIVQIPIGICEALYFSLSYDISFKM